MIIEIDGVRVPELYLGVQDLGFGQQRNLEPNEAVIRVEKQEFVARFQRAFSTFVAECAEDAKLHPDDAEPVLEELRYSELDRAVEARPDLVASLIRDLLAQELLFALFPGRTDALYAINRLEAVAWLGSTLSLRVRTYLTRQARQA